MSNHGSSQPLPPPSLATRLLHADDPDHVKLPNHPVAPIISLSTTFRSPHPDSNEARLLRGSTESDMDQPSIDMQNPTFHVYSRYTQDTSGRCEKVLSTLLNGHALTYSSGLNSAYAALTHYSPSVIAIRRGYHGCHESIKLFARGRDVKIIDLDDDYPQLPSGHGGLLVWAETPLNPTGEARDIKKYTEKAHAVGGKVLVDATFAPPPLQDPFVQGADIVMHSGTKYFGGHSDLLCGVLAVKDKKEWDSLWHDRTFLGSNLGGLEAYLLLRSLRTLKVRVRQQSETATKLASWLHSLSTTGTPSGATDEPESVIKGRFIGRTWHASLQPRADKDEEANGLVEGEDFDPRQQMPGGWSPTFAFRTSKPEYARILPHMVTYFTPATSLGGVESLLEHRIMSDPKDDPRLIRISVGLEEFEDLRADLLSAFSKILDLESKGELKPWV
ncbi:cystathionine gamma-synthase [Violaceomyces palustris]|uniref:Cystathionine gamma-synthase n=1 Tax=Violaceomyces palustris TaxID=1673888 RepID=A0ACD0NXE8_9BASI|nr:cystathionine gamma-synthase [Violaceomyces palustris]